MYAELILEIQKQGQIAPAFQKQEGILRNIGTLVDSNKQKYNLSVFFFIKLTQIVLWTIFKKFLELEKTVCYVLTLVTESYKLSVYQKFFNQIEDIFPNKVIK